MAHVRWSGNAHQSPPRSTLTLVVTPLPLSAEAQAVLTSGA